ncbi:MAG TPA: cellulose binding domain-containing protein [Umezawaea sp.]|nr:cellulose binding domain-containing protein [Umezawaea sp.]
MSTNGRSPGWRLGVDHLAGHRQRVARQRRQGWNGTWTDTGDVVRVANASWNGTLATGGQATIGYNANYGGTTTPFASASLNGTACT